MDMKILQTPPRIWTSGGVETYVNQLSGDSRPMATRSPSSAQAPVSPGPSPPGCGSSRSVR